jgi:hypothetical protein
MKKVGRKGVITVKVRTAVLYLLDDMIRLT